MPKKLNPFLACYLDAHIRARASVKRGFGAGRIKFNCKNVLMDIRHQEPARIRRVAKVRGILKQCAVSTNENAMIWERGDTKFHTSQLSGAFRPRERSST